MRKPDAVDVPFERRHFDGEVVMLCVRWYLGSRLSLRELAGMIAERGLPVAHTTLLRWTRRCTAASGSGQDQSVGLPQRSWRVEESRIRIRGAWRHLHRAVNDAGGTVDFWLADRPNVAGAEAFFGKAPNAVATLDAACGALGADRLILIKRLGPHEDDAAA